LLGRPSSGWSSLLTFLGMLLVTGLALADSRAFPGRGGAGGSALVLVLLAGGLVGFVVARSRMGLFAGHAAGALAGALLLLVMAGALLAPDGPAVNLRPEVIADRARDLSVALEDELRRFLVDEGPSPTGLAFLMLGLVCWTTAQFAAFTVFRYERAGPAVVATGALLFLNVALPPSDAAPQQLPVLLSIAGYSALAMLLIVQLQLVSQARGWARRRIEDPGEARRLSVRGGALFVALTVVAATSLTAVARAPAQEVGRAWAPLGGLGAELSRWLTLLAVELPPTSGTRMADRLEVADTWEPGDGVAFVAEVDGGLRGNYWWLSAYADFDGQAWTRSDATEEDVAAGELIDVPPDASAAGPHEIALAVSPRRSGLAEGTVVAPAEPLLVDRDVRVRSLGDREGLTEIAFRSPVTVDETYTVTSAAQDYRTSGGELTAAGLRSAGTDHPAWMGRYLRVDAGASGPRTRSLAARIDELSAAKDRDDPYSKAILLQDHLRGLGYRTSVEGLCRADENVPECLLRTEVGFCQHFASTMVMVLRELSIPARFVNGYLPGERADDGSYVVPRQALHAWVEVHFPGIGWVRFDPTPGGELGRFEQRPTAFAEGDAGASPRAEASASLEAVAATEAPLIEPSPSPDVGMAGVAPSAGHDLPAILGLILAGLLLALPVAGAVLLVLLVRLRRLPAADSGLAYGRIVGLARRLGHGPHPAQTEYEYAASLGEALPAVRDDVQVVTHARVASRYGHREVASEPRTLRRAYARVRTALVRAFWRARG
jgi:transglutaminase-like putative cysteine protease